MAKISSWHFRHLLWVVWLKKACKRGGHEHPRTPLATPLHLMQKAHIALFERDKDNRGASYSCR